MKRTPIRRTQMKDTPERDLIEDYVRRVKRANSSIATKVKGPPKDRMLFGYYWPASWIPEEPLKGYVRGRDDCFRWRVEELLFLHGWKFWHDEDPRRNEAGHPDLTCWREREMWLELKVRDQYGVANRMSPAQTAFANVLIAAGCEFHCITFPDDYSKLEGLVL